MWIWHGVAFCMANILRVNAAHTKFKLKETHTHTKFSWHRNVFSSKKKLQDKIIIMVIMIAWVVYVIHMNYAVELWTALHRTARCTIQRELCYALFRDSRKKHTWKTNIDFGNREKTAQNTWRNGSQLTRDDPYNKPHRIEPVVAYSSDHFRFGPVCSQHFSLNWIKSICGNAAITLFRIRIELWWWTRFYGLCKAYEKKTRRL